jgi:hypothetical protein
MIRHFPIGLVAGIASGTLTAALSAGGMLALLLFLLAPLPILIVSLGWDHKTGIIAAFSGGILVFALTDPLSATIFLLGTAFSAWFLSYAALTAEPLPEGHIWWMPPGILLFCCALQATFVFLATGFVVLGGTQGFETHARELAEIFLRLQTNTPASSPLPAIGGTQSEKLVESLAFIVPFLAAQGMTVLYVFYVWFAGRIVRFSGLLPRPWPILNRTRMPHFVPWLCLGSGLLGFMLEGIPAMAGLAFCGALVMAFALQGLGLIHDRTQEYSLRFGILTGVYLLLMVTQGLAFFLLFLAGIADTFLNLRRWQGSATPPAPRIS